jgi:iron complex outermembrane receptor protein
MENQFYFGTAAIAMAFGATAPVYAQSTGSIAIDDEIVVTAQSSDDGVAGIVVPDATKARGVITQELIQTQAAGQTILNTINLIPGVNFTQSDAYGSSGGNIRIRGFDGNRISLTFDGFPLNDSGNYAIFSNQQLDPELIEQVNVNLGTTDVDSPTASAAGGTVNYRTIKGGEDIEAKVSASVGDFGYNRVFGWINSGAFTDSGSRIWVSASTAKNDKFKGPGGIEKQQYNARFYQPIGGNGDFISLAGHYNQNRNNFYRNPSVNDLRTLFTATTIPLAANVSAASPLNLSVLSTTQQDALFNFENDATCNQPVKGAGAQNYGATGFTCTNFYGLRINPSNTGNARFNSRFTLSDKLIFTADASFQYVLANGGGYTTLAENNALAKGSDTTRAGVDFNADGDFLDTVGFYTPNNTNTRRYTAIMSLIYDIDDNHRFRLAYTFDRARHRQTGEWGYLNSAGFPENVFGGRNGPAVLNADGFQLQQRDRLSIALLNQVAGQYIGKFADDKLRVEIGVRAPFFKRDLTQNCYTQTGGSGFATCTSQLPANLVIVPATQLTGPFPSNSLYAPFTAQYKYNKLLPNAGLTFKLTDDISTFASYAKGFSAPRTDNLYRQPIVTVTPETTDAFDLGVRYTTGKVQAQATGWYIQYQNRIVTSFDQLLGISVDRNVGKVKAYGIDANIAYSPIRDLTLYTFASYNNSKLQQDIELGKVGTVTVFAPTAGKFVTETPKWTVGGRASVDVGPVSLGAQIKYVGARFATDVNDVIAPSYTLVDANARFSFADWGLKSTFFQINASNLFNKFYFGNISTQINHGTIGGISGSNPNFSVGSPRTIMGTLQIGF